MRLCRLRAHASCPKLKGKVPNVTPSERLEALNEGRNPALIGKMKSGFAVLGDTQFLRGYSLLLAFPQVEQLLDLEEEHRLQFLKDMADLGEAVKAATGCRRINFSIYGNLDPFLHAHVWPRYDSEPDALRTIPPLNYPAEIRNLTENAYDPEKHGPLQAQIALLLRERTG